MGMTVSIKKYHRSQEEEEAYAKMLLSSNTVNKVGIIKKYKRKPVVIEAMQVCKDLQKASDRDWETF